MALTKFWEDKTMTKYQFLNELDQLLSGLDANERQEILEDYEEHFAFAKRSEKTDAEVIALVGTPQTIAAEILESTDYLQQAHQVRQTELQKDAIEIQAQAIEEQAKELEARLTKQAELLEAQAEALEAKLEEGQSFTQKTEDLAKDIVTQAGTFVEKMIGQAGVLVEKVTSEINEASQYNKDEASIHEVEQFMDITEIKNIRLETKNTKIVVKKSESEQARIHLTRGILNAYVNDNELIIEAREVKPIKKSFGFGIFINVDLGATLTLEIPIRHYELIKAQTTNARIVIEDQLVEKLDLKTQNGRIQIGQTSASSLNLSTVNARIEVTDVKDLKDAVINTTNGRIQLSNVDGPVSAFTSNAKIELENIAGDIEARTTNGKIELVNKTINQNIKMTTTNAKILVTLEELPVDALFDLHTSNAKTVLFDTTRNYDRFGEGKNDVTLITTNAKIEVVNKLDQV